MFSSLLGSGSSADMAMNNPVLNPVLDLRTNPPLFDLPDEAAAPEKQRVDVFYAQGGSCMETAACTPQASSGLFPVMSSGNIEPAVTTAALFQQCQAVAMQAALQLQTVGQMAALQPVAAEQHTVFFAGVPPMITEQQLMLVFTRFDAVERLNLFKPFNNSRTSKGCGLAVFATRPGAAAAIAALHGIFRWPNARAPMVVEWMDPRKQHRKVRTHLAMVLQPGQLLYGGMPAAPILPAAALQPSAPMPQAAAYGTVSAAACCLRAPDGCRHTCS